MDTATATALNPQNPAFAQQLANADAATAAANINGSNTSADGYPYTYSNFPPSINPFRLPYATAAAARMTPLPLPKKSNTAANQSTAKKSNVSKIRRTGYSNSNKDESLQFQTTNDLLLFYSTPIFSAALNRSGTLAPSPMSIGSCSNKNDATADNEDNVSLASDSTEPSITHATTSSTAAAAAAAKKSSPASSPDQYESSSSPSPSTKHKAEQAFSMPKATKRKASKASAKRAAPKKRKTGNQYTGSPTRLSGLPKGVTQRASGKWQAQVYFSGASRYVGVFDTSHQASRAFAHFKKYLQPYKKRAQDGEYSREELQTLIDQGRHYASGAVQEWLKTGKAVARDAAPAAKPKEDE